MSDPLTGRALDAAVATALGWQCVAWCPEFPTAVGCAPARDPHQDVEPVPLFSEDIGAAWGLVEPVVTREYGCCQLIGSHYHGWRCRLFWGPGVDGECDSGSTFGETAPLAICRAFLALNAGTAIAVPQVAQPTEDSPCSQPPG